jgi:hypothetical protein
VAVGLRPARQVGHKALPTSGKLAKHWVDIARTSLVHSPIFPQFSHFIPLAMSSNPLKLIEKAAVLIWKSIPFLFVGIILLVNTKLHTGPDLSDPISVRNDVRHQLAYLSHQIHHQELGARMQRLFPEGFLFTHVLYGLTWCELALAEPEADNGMALGEARYSFSQINSDLGRSTFLRDMVPQYGMFYNAWRNYLLAKIVEASRGQNREEVQLFTALSRGIAYDFETSVSAFPDSYPDQSWPADACVGMATLAIYNRMVAPTYDSLVEHWVKRVQIRRAPDSKLLPHKTQSETAALIEGPRGCSGVLNLYFLPEIDAQLAVDQFHRFDSLFGYSRLGLSTVREYPRGQSGMGDVDSGPVILGVGFSATIVGIGAYLKFGEVANAQAISDAVEALGFSYRWGGRKRYIWGMMAVADAFIAWARVQRADPNVTALRPPKNEAHGSKAGFHGISLGLIAVILAWRFRRKIMENVKSRREYQR